MRPQFGACVTCRCGGPWGAPPGRSLHLFQLLVAPGAWARGLGLCPCLPFTAPLSSLLSLVGALVIRCQPCPSRMISRSLKEVTLWSPGLAVNPPLADRVT